MSSSVYAVLLVALVAQGHCYDPYRTAIQAAKDAVAGSLQIAKEAAVLGASIGEMSKDFGIKVANKSVQFGDKVAIEATNGGFQIAQHSLDLAKNVTSGFPVVNEIVANVTEFTGQVLDKTQQVVDQAIDNGEGVAESGVGTADSLSQKLIDGLANGAIEALDRTTDFTNNFFDSLLSGFSG